MRGDPVDPGEETLKVSAMQSPNDPPREKYLCHRTVIVKVLNIYIKVRRDYR